MIIKQGDYVKSVQSRSVIYQIKKVTGTSVFVKSVNDHSSSEYEVPKSTFAKRFHQAR